MCMDTQECRQDRPGAQDEGRVGDRGIAEREDEHRLHGAKERAAHQAPDSDHPKVMGQARAVSRQKEKEQAERQRGTAKEHDLPLRRAIDMAQNQAAKAVQDPAQ